MQNLVKTLQSNNVPIDGIGMESHFIVGEVPTTLVENFQAFTALGVEIAITELDIRMTLPETAELLEQQKQDFYTVVDACLQVSGCRGITVWDWTDKVSFALPSQTADERQRLTVMAIVLVDPLDLLRPGCGHALRRRKLSYISVL